MRLSMLCSVSLFALTVASPAVAKPQFASLPNHKFSGGIQAGVVHNSNAATAPKNVGLDDDDEDEDLADLEEAIDEGEIDDEDIAEILGGEDEDGNGIPDVLEDADDEDEPAAGVAFRNDDYRATLKFNAGHQYTFSKMFAWKSAALIGGGQNKDFGNLDNMSWAVSTGPVVSLTKQLKLMAALTYAEAEKQQRRVSNSTVMSYGAEYSPFKDWKFQARYNKIDQDVVPANAPDANIDVVKFGVQHKLTPNDAIKFAFAPEMRADSGRNSQDKSKWGIEAGYAHKFPYKITGALDYKFAETDFGNVARDDEDVTYTAQLRKEFENKIFVAGGVQYKERNSNIVAKNNSNTAVFVNTGWKF